MGNGIDLGIEGLRDYREIGSGGFSRVYAALDEDFNRLVAVKVLFNLDEDGQRRFDRERGLMGRLDDHPHVATAYRSGYTNDGHPYLVMEYITGGSLQDRVTRYGPERWDSAVALIEPIAQALAQAHAKGILHRDVKPANILLTGYSQPKLCDFGISTSWDATATQPALSVAYAAPEAFADGTDRRDHRSDLYSLAATMYFLVMGKPPFHAEGEDSAASHIFRIVDFAVPEAGTDARHNSFFARTLAKDPNVRPQNATEFTALLRATLGPAPTPEAAPPAAGVTVADPGGPELLNVVSASANVGAGAAVQAGDANPPGIRTERVQSSGIAGRIAALGLVAAVALLAVALLAIGGPDAPADENAADAAATGDEAQPEDTPPEDETFANDEAEVRSVHSRYMTQLFNRDERELPPAEWLPLAEELTTGRALVSIRRRTASRIETGDRLVSPGYRSNIVSVTVNGQVAFVVDCSQDTGVLYNSDGEVRVEADDFHKIRTTTFTRVDGRWFIEHLDTGGERCEPET